MKKRLDIYIRPEYDTAGDGDSAAIKKVQQLAVGYSAQENGGDRLRVHLVLANRVLASTLRRLPLESAMASNIELYAYTIEDLWAMEVLGIAPGKRPLLDREAITYESNKRVHLVIFGTSPMAESIAIHTALTAHYPNYCRDKRLRTRITWVADDKKEFYDFMQRYRGLLENCYRRNIELNGDDITSEVLTPKQLPDGLDFVDIEWEFVEGNIANNALQYKLSRWQNDEEQLLTVAYCYGYERNMNEMLALPRDFRMAVPVLLQCDDKAAVEFLRTSNEYKQVLPFGMKDAELPEMSSFIRMAQCINYAYNTMRLTGEEEQMMGAVKMAVATEVPETDVLQQMWNNPKLTTAKRWSNIYNAFSVNTKINSLGIDVARCGTLFSLSDREVEMLTEVEHNRWCVEELILGYRPTSREQHEMILKDAALREKFKAEFIHEDLRGFRDLGVDDTGLSVVRYDEGLIRTLPLIIYAAFEQQKGGDV
ncbi:MAG: hypothetical protein IKL54_00815 [Bacteroidaceae bacterium]|nr:hypothetical protein [Bacteroidaceae bacterium]